MDINRFCELMPLWMQLRPIWTVSIANNEGKMKCVANIHSGGDTKEEFTGFKRGHCADEDYDTLEYVISKCERVGYPITNLRMRAPFVSSLGYYAVIDIEASATEETRKIFEGLPQIFSETSMSGKGKHVFFPILRKEVNDAKHFVYEEKYFPQYGKIDRYWLKIYDHCMSLKSDDNTWEILLGQDVTFTGDIIEGNIDVYCPRSAEKWEIEGYPNIMHGAWYAKGEYHSENSLYRYKGDVYSIINRLAIDWAVKKKIRVSGIDDWENDEPKSEAYKELVELYTETEDQRNHLSELASGIWYKKSDRSRALYQIGMMMYKEIRADIVLCNNNGAEITIDDAAWILYKLLMEFVYPLRMDGKYDTKRHGVPILLDEARKFVNVAETEFAGGYDNLNYINIDDEEGADDE